MAGWKERIKNWFGKQEQHALQVDEVDREYDEMTDRLGPHKDDMMSRIEDVGDES